MFRRNLLFCYKKACTYYLHYLHVIWIWVCTYASSHIPEESQKITFSVRCYSYTPRWEVSSFLFRKPFSEAIATCYRKFSKHALLYINRRKITSLRHAPEDPLLS